MLQYASSLTSLMWPILSSQASSYVAFTAPIIKSLRSVPPPNFFLKFVTKVSSKIGSPHQLPLLVEFVPIPKI